MPLLMDVHTLDWPVTIDEVAKAHAADLQTQPDFDVRYLRYWVDEQEGKIFCLVDAPDADAVNAVHRQADGLVADTIFQVQEGVLSSSGSRPGTGAALPDVPSDRDHLCWIRHHSPSLAVSTEMIKRVPARISPSAS